MEEVYVFGDQTADCRAFFTKVFTRKDDVLLQSFLEKVTEAVRLENRTRTHPSKAVPNFNTIQELVDRYYGREAKDAAIESALVCISQFAHFIGAFEEQTHTYISPHADVRLVGLCTGLLAATAVASADSLTALIPLAVEAVRIAFRTGAHVGKVAQQIEGDTRSLSWSTIVAADEKSAQAAIDEFHKAKHITPSDKLWISAASATSVTISGPPSIKYQLFERSEFFRTHKNANVSIFAPYHASHLHSTSDIEKIITPRTRQLFGSIPPGFPVCSSVNGKPIEGKTAMDVLETALREIVMEPLRWDKVLKYCASGKATEAKVFAVGPTNLASSVVSALKASVAKVTLEDQSSWKTVPATGSKSKRESDIAIIGMSGRFPDAADHELFWQLLEKGLDVHRAVPPDRYPVESHTDPTSKKKNTSHTPFGNFIEKPGLFDARFFNMSPREAAQTDPMQRLMMVTGYEAMEMAGIVPGRTPSTKHDRIGTFYGQTSDDWREVNAAQDIDTYFISGGVRAFGPGRINYFFKFSGPSFCVDTACSSSFAAMNVAITSLRAGECDTAFTGGANVLTNSDIFSGLSRGHFLSKTGSCKTWDNDADGYCRGDGVCTVIMKRLEDALADRDPILGVIRGIGTNHSAEAVSITHPCAENQAFLFDKVLKECNVDSNDVNYVEMHGTGTQAGDGIEMESVSSVFAPRHKRRRPDQPLYVGAVKSNIGHGEAVSGVSALIKVLLMLQKNKIPPHTGIKNKMNVNFAPDLKERGVNIAFQTTAFPRPSGGKRICFINNFSAAGGNTAMLLEDGPERPTSVQPDPRETQVVTVSAKSLGAFKKTLAKIEAYVNANPSLNLADLAYTTTARRAHYTYRAAFPVSTVAQLSSLLTAIQAEKQHNPIPIATPQIAFAFTGQGSQYTAMGSKLFETSKQFRADVEEFNQIALRQGLPSIMSLIEGATEVQYLPPTVVQLGMCCIQMALTRLWKTWGVTPSVVIGHSLGEYAALQAAGVLSVADTIYLVGKRAELLEKKCTAGTHAMLAVRAPSGQLQDLVANSNGKIEIACINGVSDTVLSGIMSDIDAVAEKLAGTGHKCTKLKLPFAFHSSQVDPILSDFEELASAITYHPPHIPVISPLLSDVVSVGGVFDGFYLSRHCRKTVDFVGGLSAGMSTATISNSSVWLEVGSHPLCASMIKSCLSAPALATMKRDEDPWKIISASMAGLYLSGQNLNWDAFHKENEFLQVLNLPPYGFDEKNYWLQYTGDWLLYKGDYPTKTITAAPEPAKPKEKKFLTTSVQNILSEKVDGKKAHVVAETDLADPHLFEMVIGHLVNGSGLCPSTLYADMALSLGDYTYKLLKPDSTPHMAVGGMDNPQPLIVRDLENRQPIPVTLECTVDLDSNKAEFVVSTQNRRRTHAKCIISYENVDDWKSQWQRTSYLVQSRIDMLKHKMENGEADKVGRAMAYKLFTALVDYGAKFKGMQHVVLDGPEFEATSFVKFQAGPETGSYYINPYYIDSTCHITGFVVNAAVNPQDECYISHGWSNLRFAEKLEYGQEYYCYVKMQPVAGSKMRAGDVYIFKNSTKEVVAVAEAIRFQCVPRKLMNIMMPPNNPQKDNKASGPSTQALPPKKQIQAPAPAPSPKKPSPGTIEIPKPKPKPTKKAAAKPKVKPVAPAATSLVSKAFAIIVQELGCDASELNDEIQWDGLGVDSLMSLTISGKFREELELEVENSLFTDHCSVGALRRYLGGKSGPIIDHAPDSSSTSSADSDSESESLPESGITTPDTEDFVEMKPQTTQQFVNPTPQAVQGAPSGGDDIIAVIRATIAQEMDMDIEEITETTDLSNLGMDSLMALTVLGKLREDHEIDLDPTILADNPSLGHLRKALGLEKPTPAPPQAQKSQVSMPVPVVKAAPPVEVVVQMPPATSVLLQGNPKTATKNLFLFPDGSGSATSYVSIPAIDSKNLAVYGLNCPFMKDPTNYTCGIEGVSKLYLEEVMRRQPIGPYILGGWSAGGVVAYEVTRQLNDLAKANPGKNWYVEKLILIDSPCPVRLEPLPARLHHFFDEIGLLGTGTGKTPNWLLPHFEYSIKALTAYKPELKSTHDFNAPPTLFIWATKGVCGEPGDPRPPPQADDPKSMKWLLENRTDFGDNGWGKLIPLDKCKMVKVVGNHFTMMKPPVAKGVGSFIREFIHG